MKIKELQKWPDMQNLLSEMHLCYVAGTNVAVHLLAPQVVERYLQKVFLKDKADWWLIRYMVERAQISTEMKQDDITFNMEKDLIRQDRSNAMILLETGVQFMASQQTIRKKYSQKEARAVLRQVKQMLVFSNKVNG